MSSPGSDGSPPKEVNTLLVVLAARQVKRVLAGLLVCEAVLAQDGHKFEEYMVLNGYESAFVVSISGQVIKAETGMAFEHGEHRVSLHGTAVLLNYAGQTDGVLDVVEFSRHSPCVSVDRRRDPRWRGLVVECTEIAPHGRSVAFIAHARDELGGSVPCPQVYFLDLENGSVRQLTQFEDAERVLPTCRLSWSPDGNAIAFYWAPNVYGADATVLNLGVYVVGLDGVCVKLVEPCRHDPGLGGFTYVGPIWSRDSSCVYLGGNYGRPKDGELALPQSYSVRVVGGGMIRLCEGTPTSMTPDGQWLYASDTRGHQCRVNLQSGEVMELGAEWLGARVSPSGRYVATLPAYYGQKARAPGGGIQVFTPEGRLVASVPQVEIGLRGGPEGLFWVMRKVAVGAADGGDHGGPRRTEDEVVKPRRETLIIALAVTASVVVLLIVLRRILRRPGSKDA